MLVYHSNEQEWRVIKKYRYYLEDQNFTLRDPYLTEAAAAVVSASLGILLYNRALHWELTSGRPVTRAR